MNFLDKYTERKIEIKNFLLLMEILENKERLREVDGRTQFDIFFNELTEKNIHYTTLSNILKSNTCLMIYNLIEFTISQLLTEIYDTIANNKLTYTQLNEQLQQLWLKSELKPSSDPNANFQTIKKNTLNIIEKIVENETVFFNCRNTLDGGNVDLKLIKKIFEDHYIDFYIPHDSYRPDKFETLKTHRNNLAHGATLFSEELANNTIREISDLYEIVIKTLEKLIRDTDNYILLHDFCHEKDISK